MTGIEFGFLTRSAGPASWPEGRSKLVIDGHGNCFTLFLPARMSVMEVTAPAKARKLSLFRR